MPTDQATDPVESLVLDLLEWLGTSARPYDEVMDAWRTSCPRLPVWETANDLGLVERCRTGDSRPGVALTTAGRRFLALRRPRLTPTFPLQECQTASIWDYYPYRW